MNFEISMLAGPLVGAVIGYCTNYIAVKMLFRPLKPIKLGNYTLPFTPGIIPKGKERLAKALGRAVGDTLLTKEDMQNALLSEEVKKQASDSIAEAVLMAPSIKELTVPLVEEEKYMEIRGIVLCQLENKILDAIKEADLGNIVVSEGTKAIKTKLGGGLFGMFMSDDLIASVAEPLRENIERYIEEKAPVLVEEMVEKEAVGIEDVPIGQAVADKLEREQLCQTAEKAYTLLVENQLGSILEKLDVAGVVEQKINDMDVLEVEKMTLSIMKKELDAVVNLGALIGFVIGIINVFI